MRAAAVAEDVPVASPRIGQRLDEPRVRRAGVVGDQVHGDPDAAGVRGIEQAVQGVDAAEQRVDIAGSTTSYPWSAIGDTITGLSHRALTPSAAR